MVRTGGKSMPEHVKPMLAKVADAAPEGDEWGLEIKWDGVRALAYVDGDRARIESRTFEPLDRRYPELAGLGDALAGHSAVLDGEIVAMDADGNPSFQLLQRRMGLSAELSIQRRVAETAVTYMAFDLLHLDGRSTMEMPYAERRRMLEGLELAGRHWQTPGYHVGQGRQLVAATRAQGLEGIVAKRLDSPYRPGRRSGEWVKVRNRRREAFVIGGWTPGAGGRTGTIGAILVGYWDSTPAEAKKLSRPQHLVFAGGVGTGFTDVALKQLQRLLEARRRPATAFDAGAPKRGDAEFCEPDLVCEVEYMEWTREDTLRQPSFKGLRDDVDPRQVVREPG